MFIRMSSFTSVSMHLTKDLLRGECINTRALLGRKMKSKQDKLKPKKNCDGLKKFLLKTFLFVRYYVDQIIDCGFGYYFKSKKQILPKSLDPLLTESGTSIARRIKKRELKSEEVVSSFIKRIKEVNPIINAVVDNRFEEAVEEAKKIDQNLENNVFTEQDFQEKPFLGVPFTTKESTAVKGLSFTFGMKKRKGRVASFDADYVTLMKKAGGICLGVTNVPEYNRWQETHNVVYGTTNNPYDTTRNVGGSSGGEASILAAGGTPIGIGTDIGGSCRIPAYMCGVFGHKPTSHLIPTRGMTFRTGNEKQTIVAAGPMTKYAEDLTPLLDCLIEDRDKAAQLKLYKPIDIKTVKIYYISNPNDIHISPFRPEMRDILKSAVTHFSGICETNPKKVDFEGTKYTTKLWKFWMLQESDNNFLLDIMDKEKQASPFYEIIKHFTIGSDFSLSTIYSFINTLLPSPKKEWAEKQTKKLKKELLEILDDYSVLLYPSSPWPASYHYTSYLRPWNFNLFCIWNVVKFPVTQVPMGLKNGLPVGIQVVAAPNQDRLCFKVAKELEKAFGGYVPPFK